MIIVHYFWCPPLPSFDIFGSPPPKWLINFWSPPHKYLPPASINNSDLKLALFYDGDARPEVGRVWTLQSRAKIMRLFTFW